MNSNTNHGLAVTRPDGPTIQPLNFQAGRTRRSDCAGRPAKTALFLARWAAALIVVASTAHAQWSSTPKKPSIGDSCSILVSGEYGSKHSATKRNPADDRTRSRVKGKLMVFDERWVMVETKGGWQVWIPRSAVVSLRTKDDSK